MSLYKQRYAHFRKCWPYTNDKLYLWPDGSVNKLWIVIGDCKKNFFRKGDLSWTPYAVKEMKRLVDRCPELITWDLKDTIFQFRFSHQEVKMCKIDIFKLNLGYYEFTEFQEYSEPVSPDLEDYQPLYL